MLAFFVFGSCKIVFLSWFEWNNWDLVTIHDGFHRLSLYGGSNVALYAHSLHFYQRIKKSRLERKHISKQERQRRNKIDLKKG